MHTFKGLIRWAINLEISMRFYFKIILFMIGNGFVYKLKNMKLSDGMKNK